MSGPWIAALVALWVLMIVIAVGLLGLIRIVTSRNTRTADHGLGSLSDLQAGDRPADFEAAGLDGASITMRALRGGRRVLLITQHGCPPCRRIIDEIAAAGSGSLSPQILVVVDDAHSVSQAHRRSGVTIAVDQNGSLARAFGVNGAPLAFLVDDGEIESVIIPAGLHDVLALNNEQPLGTTSRSVV
jgi:hypothetical protein